MGENAVRKRESRASGDNKGGVGVCNRGCKVNRRRMNATTFVLQEQQHPRESDPTEREGGRETGLTGLKRRLVIKSSGEWCRDSTLIC